MHITESQITSIIYEKDNGETSTRVILPVSVPSTNIRAIDVSDVPETERENLADLLQKYRTYKDNIIKNMFTFEDWVEHTTNTPITPKWRTFKISGLR